MNYNSYAAASTSVLPLPWTEEARTHPLHLPFSASTPVITLSPPTTSDGIINEEPEDIALGSPLSPPAETSSPQSPFSPNGPVAPSQSTDETVHLALILAFGNDKYSSAHAPTPPMHKSYSTPPSYFPGRPKIPARGRFAHSPSPTPPQSPSSTPTHRGSREQSPRDSTSSEARSRPSSKQRTSDPGLEASARDQVPPLPPLDLRFESDYSSDSPTSAGSAGALGTGFKSQARRSTYNLNSQPLRKPEGTVMLPIPLMLRPRPIWRTTPRSALSSPAYSPASHLVRRSTFIAAGLDLDSPVADLSALSVETRALMFGRDAGVVLPGFDV